MAKARCTHLRALPDADGKVRVRKDRSYACCAPVPTELLNYLPKSVTKGYDFEWPPRRFHVSVETCAGCPLYLAAPSADHVPELTDALTPRKLRGRT
jgi:hypothetical protein